jgi:hypothetical protein
MVRITFIILALASAGLAQSSSDGTFSVRHSKDAKFLLNAAQIREAESLYRSAYAEVQRDLHITPGELHPDFTVIMGADHNQIRDQALGRAELWMTKWDPIVFTQGVVFVTFHQMLTADLIVQLSNRAIRRSNATVDAAGLK